MKIKKKLEIKNYINNLEKLLEKKKILNRIRKKNLEKLEKLVKLYLLFLLLFLIILLNIFNLIKLRKNTIDIKLIK